MELQPPKEKETPSNTGIAVNEFNVFRRRLPQMGGTGGQMGGTGGQMGGAPKRSALKGGDPQAKERERETRVRFQKLAGYAEEEKSSGGSGTAIIIAGLIVALFLFQ